MKTFMKPVTVVFLFICFIANATQTRSMDAPTGVQFNDAEPTLKKGSRIRFWSIKFERDPYIGVVKQIREDKLILAVEGYEGDFRLPLVDLERLEISREPGRNHIVAGALVGGVIFGFGALALNHAVRNQADVGSGGEAFITSALLGGAIGALVGLAISSGEEWEEVPLDTLRVGRFRIDRGDVLLAVSLKF